MTKRVIQVYKAPHQWRGSPPGMGDFVRGACHLYERLEGTGISLRLDVSQTGFVDLIEQAPEIFQSGDVPQIAAAAEHFDEPGHQVLLERIKAFSRSSLTELYVCTNIGDWNRLTLPERTRTFMRGFYRFGVEVEAAVAAEVPAEYEVLSVRCGDEFYRNTGRRVSDAVARRVRSIVEARILPRAQRPIVVTSDCYTLKRDLVDQYGMAMLPHASEHGAFGHVRPVVLDLCLLKHSRFNHHINAWTDWWSGFSHYTSLVFQIPGMNFRAERFAREEVTATGELLTDPPWWRRLFGG